MPIHPSMKPQYPPDWPHHSAGAIARDYLLKEAHRLGLMDAPADRPHRPDNDLRG